MSHGLDDAAAAALFNLSRLQDPTREHIGLLYGDDYRRTPTQTREARRSTGGAFKIPPGGLRALFHNHPESSQKGARPDTDRSRFSYDDIAQAKKLGVPSYISAGEQVFRYDPSTRKTEEVLAQIPLEEIRRLYLAEGLKR